MVRWWDKNNNNNGREVNAYHTRESPPKIVDVCIAHDGERVASDEGARRLASSF